MRADASRQYVVAVDDKVVRCNRRTQTCILCRGVVDGVCGRYVFHHHTQTRRTAPDRGEHAVDENGFAVENVDIGIRDFAVHAKWQPNFRHAFEHAPNLVKIAHATCRVGCSARGIKLYRIHQTCFVGGRDIVRIGIFCQVKRHERLEGHPFGQSLHDPVAVGFGICACDHRRHKVGHDDGPCKMRGRRGQHSAQHGAISKVEVPVIRAAQGQRFCHGTPLTQRRILRQS